MTRLLRGVLVASLLCAAGVQWALLQSVAWAGMLASESRRAPLGAAVARTFDGRHLCTLCLAVRKVARSEGKPGAKTTETRLEFHFEPEAALAVGQEVRLAGASVPIRLLPAARVLDVPPPEALPA